ncbi:MAG: hypothetical protein ACRCXM_09225 [Beijerinckiaceae bacterium]
MISHSLRAFVEDVARRQAFTDEDMRFLDQARASCACEPRELVELFLVIDSLTTEKPAGWPDFLIDTIVDMLVWGERPTGVVTTETADWLLARVAPTGFVQRGAQRALIVAIVREAQICDPRLAAIAFGVGQARPAPVPMTRTLGWLDSSGIGV